MSTSSTHRRQLASSTNWQVVLAESVIDDGSPYLDRADAAFLRAVDADDWEAQIMLSASALAFMLLDWSSFARWLTWVVRFDAADVFIRGADQIEPALACAAATGRLSSALLRGDPPETLARLGADAQTALEHLPKMKIMTPQLALTSCVLLPWLQMSRNVAQAQVLHAGVMAVCQIGAGDNRTIQFFLGHWLGVWAQHLHFVDQARFPEALREFDDYLKQNVHRTLQFKRDRLFVEQALFAGQLEHADQGLRAMLAALQPQRPMQRAIYNSMAATAALKRDDADAALLHFNHMQRDLLDADCPPSISSTYQLKATSVCLAKSDYLRAAEMYAQCASQANATHADVIRGFGSLAHALHLHEHSDPLDLEKRDELRAQLHDGLAAMRRVPNPSFFFSAPHARSAICALAFREGIDTEFVASSLRFMPVAPPDWADENWPWPMALRCLGRFSNSAKLAEGQVAGKATSRPLHLLMLIAAHGTQGVAVSVAMDCLWPGQDGAQAEHSLTMTLVRLRRLFVDDQLIERDHGWLRLSATKVWTDVRALESILDEIAVAETIVTDARRLQQVVRLFELYRGECLAGVDDGWARERAKHYRARVHITLQRVLREACANGYNIVVELVVAKALERELDLSRIVAGIPTNDSSKTILDFLRKNATLP